MAITMRTDGWARRDTGSAALIIAAASALLILSGSRLVAELNRIPTNSYYNRHQPEFLSPDNGPRYAQEAANRLNQVPHVYRNAQSWQRLATALTALPLPDHIPNTVAVRKEAIAQALTETLRRNPVQALSWSYLAHLEMPPHGNCGKAMAALRQSFHVVPVEPDFLAYRLQLAARCPLHWDTPLLAALRRNIVALYSGRPRYARNRAFVTWLSDRPQLLALARRLLAQQEEVYSRLERDLSRFVR